METIVVLQNQPISLPPSTTYAGYVSNTTDCYRETTIVTDPYQNQNPFLPSGMQAKSFSRSLLYRPSATAASNRRMQATNDSRLQIRICLKTDTTACYNNIQYKGLIRVQDVGPSGLLNTLYEQYGEALKLKVDICNIVVQDYYYYGSIEMMTDRGWFQMIHGRLLSSRGTYEWEEDKIPLNHSSSNGFTYNIHNFMELWFNRSYSFQGNLSISAVITKVTKLMGVDKSIEDPLSITKQILKEEICCDVTIIPKNGVNIKCHKNFLFAQSSVFQTMFQSSMQESKTNIVKISDMTEASVRAMLAYLYYWDVQEAEKSSLICYELLHAGHKYDIVNLEKCMKTILLSKGNDWYDVDVAMRLFLFSRNLPEGSDLKMKSIQVLKSKFSILETSECYQKLFKKDPKAAMELCKYAFSV